MIIILANYRAFFFTNLDDARYRWLPYLRSMGLVMGSNPPGRTNHHQWMLVVFNLQDQDDLDKGWGSYGLVITSRMKSFVLLPTGTLKVCCPPMPLSATGCQSFASIVALHSAP